MNNLKRKSIAEFEASIELTERYFVKQESHIRFSYRMHGKNEQFTLATPLEVAQFLKTHGIINTYAVHGESVTMYSKTILTTIGAKGEPVLRESLTPFIWADIDFSPSDVVRFAAHHEWDKTAKHFTTAKVIEMFKPIVRRVA